MTDRPFNAGATLAFLDEITERFGSARLLSIESAWDAAWIVCMTLDPRHEAAAQAALADVTTEVSRLSIMGQPARANAPAAQVP